MKRAGLVSPSQSPVEAWIELKDIDGLAWLLGLLQGGFGLTGFDAVAHMIEEM